jgi:hypothetical protein
MTETISPIYLIETASEQGVPADLRDVIGEPQLDDWESKWMPALISILSELVARGVPQKEWPQSAHWNWRAKIDRLKGLIAYKGYSVVCNGTTQGLMSIDLTKSSRIQKRKPLVYIDYLEAAPWNRSELGGLPRYRGVGTALITAAVELSMEEGFRGRIGLHALPQSEDFYRKVCGMDDLDYDSSYQNLRYFEMTSKQAEAFLENGG